jgi:protease IV
MAAFMKTFFASLLGTLAALVLFLVGGFMIGLLVLGTIAALGDKPAAVEKGAYLVFDMSADIADSPPQFDSAALRALFSEERGPQFLQLRKVTRALRAAASDDRVGGVVVIGSFRPAGYGTGYAALREVRSALAQVRAAGKPVVAHLEYPTTRDFYVASVASDLALDPYGLWAVPGLASEPTFLTGVFDRFGIGVQVSRVGKYKSAVEPFTRRDLSPENREQITRLLDDVWTELRDAVAETRGLEPAALQAMIDDGSAFHPQRALERGLVDRLAYRDEIVAELKQATRREGSRGSFLQVSLPDYIRQLNLVEAGSEESPAGAGGSQGRVAIVYAEGPIVDGEGRIGEVGGEKFARELRRLRNDPQVRAIVLRVNSPGGSATASEHIQRELRLARESKPVVVSMGTYAASGGYWISAYADRIFAESATITGSIGVFGVFFNVQELGHNLGFSWDTVKTGQYADILTIVRPKTPDEMALIQTQIDWIYDAFIQKVAEARRLPTATVEEIAQGRVWSGAAAQELGLVDEIGGLAEAVAHAAGRAGLRPGFRITEFPQHKDLSQLIAEAMGRIQPTATRSGLVRELLRQAEQPLELLQQFNDPRGAYARLPFELGLN